MVDVGSNRWKLWLSTGYSTVTDGLQEVEPIYQRQRKTDEVAIENNPSEANRIPEV
jgi:hypothetical protein